MATDAQTDMTAAELLHFYLGMRLQSGGRKQSIREILAGFPEYLRQRDRMRSMIQVAEEDIAAGRSGPLDVEQAINEVVGELAAQGITEQQLP